MDTRLAWTHTHFLLNDSNNKSVSEESNYCHHIIFIIIIRVIGHISVVGEKEGFENDDSRWHNDDLDEADEEKDEGGAGHIGPEPGVHLFRILQERTRRRERNSL